MTASVPSYAWEAIAIWCASSGAALALHFGPLWWRSRNRRKWWQRPSSWRFPHGLRLE